MDKTIVLIGAGQLGSRHLQALCKVENPINIRVVEKSDEAVKTAQERVKQVPGNDNILSIEYYKDINEIGEKEIELVIVATNSDERANVIKNVVKNKSIKYMIIEKFLFQTEAEYGEILEVLNKNNIKAWVNSPMRIWPFYREVKKILKEETKISMMMQGGNWGMACNSIHYLDCITYLNECFEFDVFTDGLDNTIYDSKRISFIEFGGTLRIKFANDSELILKDQKDSTAPVVITIQSKNTQFVFHELDGNAEISTFENNWKTETKKYDIPYQSNLTNLLVQELFANGTCSLLRYEDSIKLHLKLLKGYFDKIEKITNEKVLKCKIT